MLTVCMTTVVDGKLHCAHYNKNDRFVGGVDSNLTAKDCTSLTEFSSAHAGRKVVMRNAVLGLFHRMYMNTLIADTVLQNEATTFAGVGFPITRKTLELGSREQQSRT
jgi:hypothetical protein